MNIHAGASEFTVAREATQTALDVWFYNYNGLPVECH
jgi:hypothetical protein